MENHAVDGDYNRHVYTDPELKVLFQSGMVFMIDYPSLFPPKYTHYEGNKYFFHNFFANIGYISVRDNCYIM